MTKNGSWLRLSKTFGEYNSINQWEHLPSHIINSVPKFNTREKVVGDKVIQQSVLEWFNQKCSYLNVGVKVSGPHSFDFKEMHPVLCLIASYNLETE